MTDIPSDIRESVRKIFEDRAPNLFDPHLMEAFEASLLAERYRCASLASHLDDGEVKNEFDLGWSAALFEMRGNILGWERVVEKEA